MDEQKIIQFPMDKPDMQEMMVDGKPETMLSARGVVLIHLASWREDSNEKAHSGLRRYCEYITMHGYPGGASAAMAELDRLDKPQSVEWIKRTRTVCARPEGAYSIHDEMKGDLQ